MFSIQRNLGYIVSTFAIFVLVLAPPNLVCSQDFRITYPEKNSTVQGEVIVVEGVGAIPGATIEISVLTNEWYLQNGIAEISEDGNWTYAPCYLSGQGKFNNHSIKARLIQDGRPIATVTVRGIVRE